MSKGNSRRQERRTFLSTVSGSIGAIALGSAMIGSTETVHAETGTDPDDPYDEPEEEVIHNDQGSEFAEVHSATTGPKRVSDEIGSVNLAVAFPISIDEDVLLPSVENARISVEGDGSPGDYDLQNIVTYEQGESDSDLDDVVEYAMDAAWSSSVGLVLPAPSPWSLVETGDPDVSQDANETYIESDFPTNNGYSIGLLWEVDFHIGGDGTVPTGSWNWEVTCEADIGHISTGATNPGFQEQGSVSQTHEVEINVEDDL